MSSSLKAVYLPYSVPQALHRAVEEAEAEVIDLTLDDDDQEAFVVDVHSLDHP